MIISKRMSKHTTSFVGLIALSLSLVLLASCATELTDDSVTPTPSPSPPRSHTSTPPHLHTPTLPPTPPPEPSPTSTNPPPPQPALVEHIVQSGDTLLDMAMEYDVPIAAIQLQNEMGDSTVVQVGQVLSIPPRAGWEGASRFWVVHVVKAGETLVGIARTYGLKAADLKTVNGLTDADLLGISQELVLPLDAPAVARAPVPTATPIPPPTPTPVAISAPLTATVSSPLPTTAPVVAMSAPAPPPADVAAWPHEIVRLINETRAQHGLPPLAYNETLAQVAQAHANDCLQRGWGSHYGSDGSNVKTRMQRAGYTPARWSECWAHTQSPQNAMYMWMDETPPNDPHRRTILNPSLTEVGVGVVQPDWGYYFFADFGRPRDGP